MKLKQLKSYIGIMALILVVGNLTNCASTDEEGLEENEFMNDESANEFVESEAVNNSEDGEFDNTGDEEFANSEDVNNFESNEFDNNAEGGLNLANNPYDETAEPEVAEEPVDNFIPVEQGLNLGSNSGEGGEISPDAAEIANAVNDTGVPAVDAPVQAQPIAAGGQVKYVKMTSSLLESPEGGVIGTLEKGDHPVIIEDSGSFSKTKSGQYIQSNHLSDGVVGRSRNAGQWRMGR